MPPASTARLLPLAAPPSAPPASVFDAWPADRALIALLSGDGLRARNPDAPRWARWTILAEPLSTLPADETHPFTPLDAATAATRRHHPAPEPASDPDTPPFRGGVIGWLSYDLGRAVEPTAVHRAPRPAADDPADWPLLAWHRCPAAYVHDAHTGAWWAVGTPEAAASLPAFPTFSTPIEPSQRSFHLGPLAGRTGRDAYEAAVARAVALIHAGDAFQINLAHRLSGPFEGSARALFRAMAAAAAPWYGAYIEAPIGPEGGGDGDRRIIASASPELFLELDPRSRRVVSRPIKGTRRGDRDPAELAGSAKDLAELNMIIDLMRNDLGRVGAIGSVRVDEARVIERHAAAPYGRPDERGGGGRAGARSPGVLHGVATVSAILRDGVGLAGGGGAPARGAGLLGAAFPPGSVTGAPKVRAMQMIDELEPVRRGPYCGAIGYASDSGHAALSVAIRTALLSGRPGPGPGDLCRARLDLSVGAGIVADSAPAAEWLETLDKAATIRSLSSAHPPPTAERQPHHLCAP